MQNLFIKAADHSLQCKKSPPGKNWKKRKKSKKWFDKECTELKRGVREVGKRKQEIPNSNLLKKKYHEKLKEYKSHCKTKRFEYWKEKVSELENVSNDPKIFWKKWNNIDEVETVSSQPKISGDDWYNHFSNLHHEDEVENLNRKVLETDPKIQNCKMEFNQPFSKEEFQVVIHNLKTGKAVGVDSISNDMIKSSPKIIQDLLLKYINLCLEKSLISEHWCYDIITAIHKEGSVNDPNNYRGISISSALLKVVCTLLNNRLELFCTKHNIINKNQIGFRPKHRACDHLLTLKSLVKKYVTIGKKKIFACFVDFKKAFDSIWHEGLFYKMNGYGIGGKTLDLIKDIYKKTKCAIKSNNSRTSFFNYEKGVRQGCPLSPMLFNIYVNDLFKTMNSGNDSDLCLDENGHKTNILMYADDLIILSESKENLQKQIDKLENYCSKWKLQINNKKTKVMIFNRGNKLINTKFHTKTAELQNVKEFKYLGITISANNCTFSPTIRDLSIKANRAVFALNSKIKLSKLPTKLALRLFNSLVLPILLYGSEVWGPYADLDFTKWDGSKTEQVHVQFIKRILGCNFSTSNIMSRGEVGQRPLLVDVLRRHISYIQDINKRQDCLVFEAFTFERNNNVTPNFSTYANKFNLNLTDVSKDKTKKYCHDLYDRFWKIELENSPKAISYKSYKNNINLESYLIKFKSVKHRISLSRFRLSDHNLMIVKGRHSKPKIEIRERKCYFCRDKIENEEHLLLNCPLYIPERICFEKICRENCLRYDNLDQGEKFIYIMSNEDPNIMHALGKFILNSLNLRENMVNYFFLH